MSNCFSILFWYVLDTDIDSQFFMVFAVENRFIFLLVSKVILSEVLGETVFLNLLLRRFFSPFVSPIRTTLFIRLQSSSPLTLRSLFYKYTLVIDEHLTLFVRTVTYPDFVKNLSVP